MNAPLNFCRQIVRELSTMPPSFAKKDPRKAAQIINVLRMIELAQKFLMPKGGRLFDDPIFRGLDSDERLSLPFDVVALEYEPQRGPRDDELGPDAVHVAKTVILAEQDETHIFLQAAWLRAGTSSGWVFPAEIAIDRNDWERQDVDGTRAFAIHARNVAPFEIRDYCDELGALMAFLNALACSNVQIDKVPQKGGDRKIKSSLPFDSYHVLTVATATHESTGRHHEGRSPREHLRRGHIRRLSDGRKVWVNATVVNAGVGHKVVKDYRVTA